MFSWNGSFLVPERAERALSILLDFFTGDDICVTVSTSFGTGGTSFVRLLLLLVAIAVVGSAADVGLDFAVSFVPVAFLGGAWR